MQFALPDTSLTIGSSSAFDLATTYPKVAWIFRIPKSGTINKLGVQLGTITTSHTLRLSLQTTSSGLPSGSYYGGSSYQTFTPSASGPNEVTLGTTATATEGDEVAVVLEWDSTVGDLNVINIGGGYFQGGYYPLSALYTSGAWAVTNSYWFCFFAGYNDGTFADTGMLPAQSVGSQTFSQNLLSNPDELGIQLTMPCKAKVDGLWVYGNANSSPEDTLVLYDTDGTTVLASVSVHPGDSTSGPYIRFFKFSSTVTLQQGLTYTVSYKSGSTSNCHLAYATYGSADALAANPDGPLAITGVSQYMGGGWSTANTRYFLGISIQQVLSWASQGASYPFQEAIVSFSATIMSHFLNPQHGGALSSPDGEGWAGALETSRFMRIQLHLEAHRIAAARFGTYGCAAAIAAGDWLCDWSIGRTLAEAATMTAEELEAALGGLPESRRYCASLAIDALHAALADATMKGVRP